MSAGISFKPEYIDQVLSSHESDLWLEVHTENYLVDGGIRLEYLEKLRQRFDISFHGVSASLGGNTPLPAPTLNAIKQLIERFQPKYVSEHAVWSRRGDDYMPDLLPLPRTLQAMQQLINGVTHYQEAIGRSILLENPTNYLDFISEMDEPEFLIEVAKRSGCGLLLDINNLYLSSINCGINAQAYIDKLPVDMVGEIHIAGYSVDPAFGEKLYIDSHAEPVSEPVWELLQYALQRLGKLPVLVERDSDLPPWSELIAERNRAQSLIHHAGYVDYAHTAN